MHNEIDSAPLGKVLNLPWGAGWMAEDVTISLKLLINVDGPYLIMFIIISDNITNTSRISCLM